MKGFFKEFKEFAMQGNVMDMAIGVVIGAAFKAIVDSLVSDIINPIIGVVGGTDLSGYVLKLGTVELKWGSFVSAIINFILIALVLFLVVRTINKTKNLLPHKEEAPAAPTEKECPFCKSMIPIGATRCPNCTSKLEGFEDMLNEMVKADKADAAKTE